MGICHATSRQTKSSDALAAPRKKGKPVRTGSRSSLKVIRRSSAKRRKRQETKQLKALMKVPSSLHYLQLYCRRNYCDEVILCCVDCEKYRNLFKSESGVSVIGQKNARKEAAEELRRKYLDADSMQEVNVSQQLRRKIFSDLENYDNLDMDRMKEIFDDLQYDMLNLLELNVLVNFHDSPEYDMFMNQDNNAEEQYDAYLGLIDIDTSNDASSHQESLFTP